MSSITAPVSLAVEGLLQRPTGPIGPVDLIGICKGASLPTLWPFNGPVTLCDLGSGDVVQDIVHATGQGPLGNISGTFPD